MTRGVKVDIEDYITNISEFLKTGCSINEACLHGKVPYTTVLDYYKQDENIRNKIDRLMATPILEARKKVIEDISKNVDTAKWYLERKKRAEFSTQTTTHNVASTYEEFLSRCENEDEKPDGQ